MQITVSALIEFLKDVQPAGRVGVPGRIGAGIQIEDAIT